jgi:putative transcriptional regulator
MNCYKNCLKENGFNPAWLAEKLDKPYVIVDAYIQNRKQPRLEVHYEIASIRKVDPKYIINSNIK